jgi:hypothetical protein
MDNKKIAKELLALAKDIAASETTTALRKSQEGGGEGGTAEEDAEDPLFMKKVMVLRPSVLKKLNRVRNRKLKTQTDKLSLTMTVNDMVDVLIDLVNKYSA